MVSTSKVLRAVFFVIILIFSSCGTSKKSCDCPNFSSYQTNSEKTS